MSFALVTNNAITQTAGRIPNAAQRLDSRAWVLPESGQWSAAEAAACGWFPVIDVARPADNATTTHDRTVELVNGTPTVAWTPRPWSAAELAARTEQTNRTAIEQGVRNALLSNRIFLNDDTPTNAELVAQVRSLTNQMNAIIRVTVGLLDGTN